MGLLHVDEDPDTWFSRLMNVCGRLEDIGMGGAYKKEDCKIKAHIINQLTYDVYRWIISMLRQEIVTLSLDEIKKIICDKHKVMFSF